MPTAFQRKKKRNRPYSDNDLAFLKVIPPSSSFRLFNSSVFFAHGGEKDSYAVKPKKRTAMKYKDSYSVGYKKKRKKENFRDTYSSRRNRPKNYDAPKQKYREKRWYDVFSFGRKGKRKMKEPRQKRRRKPQMGLFGPKGK